MADRTLNAFLDPRTRKPACSRIAEASAREVRCGRPRPGDPPAMAPCPDLQAQGWVTSRPVTGSGVAASPTVEAAREARQ